MNRCKLSCIGEIRGFVVCFAQEPGKIRPLARSGERRSLQEQVDPQLPFSPGFEHVSEGIPTRGPQAQNTATREVRLNQQVKDLIQKLGEAIHESVSESEDIAGVVREIREQGFDVLLMLEATIGLNEVSEEEDAVESEEGNESEDGGPFTRNDITFLKSLRITTEDQSGAADTETVEPDEA